MIRDIGLASNSDRELQPYQRYEGHTGCVEVHKQQKKVKKKKIKADWL